MKSGNSEIRKSGNLVKNTQLPSYRLPQLPTGEMLKNYFAHKFTTLIQKARKLKASLQAQLVFLLLMVSLVPLLWVSYLAYSNGKKVLERSIGANLSRIAAEKVSIADRNIVWCLDQMRHQIPSVRQIVLATSKLPTAEITMRWEKLGETVDGAKNEINRLATVVGEKGEVIITDTRGNIIGARDTSLNVDQSKERKHEKLNIKEGKRLYELTHSPIIRYSEVVYVDGQLLTRDNDYTIDYPKKQIILMTSPPDGVLQVKYNVKESKSEDLNINDGKWLYELTHKPIIPYSEVVYVGGQRLTRDNDYTIDYPKKQIILMTSPSDGVLQVEYNIIALWYRKSYNGGRGHLFIGDVSYNEQTNLHYIPIAMPIRRTDEIDAEVIGLLKMVFTLPELTKIVDPQSNAKIAEGIKVYIIDGNGTVIAAPLDDGYHIIQDKMFTIEAGMRAIVEKSGYTTEKDERDGIRRVYGFTSTSNWRNRKGKVRNDYRDSERIRNFASWAVIVSQPAKIAFAPARKLRNSILLFTFISCLIVIPIAVIFARKIVTPIMRVADAAKDIGMGKFDREIPVTVHNEIGMLVEEFNAMRRNLKHAEDQLRQNAKKMTAIVNSIAEGLIVLDGDNRILHINPTAEELLNIKSEKPLRPFASLTEKSASPLRDVRGVDIATVLGDHEMYMAIEESQKQIIRHETAAQEVVLDRGEQQLILRVLASPVIDDEGQFLGTVYALDDITEAKKIDRMKSDFIDLVSHEFRTPLTSIRGFVELILDGKVGPVPPKQERSLMRVLRQAKSLQGLINDMLDVSRIESGSIGMRTDVTSLAEIAKYRIEALKPQADDKQITVEFIAPDSLPNVIGDSERIGQVFTNLIGNAIKFTPPSGRVTVQLRLKGTYILVQVIDTGPGIPIDEREKIFEKFHQLSDLHTRQEGGSGLGLSISKSIVEAHGGRIWVHSQEGKGSDFRFILPIAGMSRLSDKKAEE